MSTFVPPAPPAYGAGAEETAARGSYGPVICMLAVVVVLAAAAVAVGRLCFGRGMEAWVERKCGPCVGVTRAAAGRDGGGSDAAVSVPAATELMDRAERGETSGGGS
jgi:hypothetical protein